MKILLLLAVLLPLAGGAALFVRPAKSRAARNAWVLSVCALTSLLVLALLAMRAGSGQAPVLTLLPLAGDTLALALHMDGLSAVFAALVALLWPLADVYAFEYMRREPRENSFFAFFTMTYGVVLGIAFAQNLFTLYFFYELLTLCTLPLVMHEQDGKARYAGKKYLLYSMSGAALAFISLMFVLANGRLDFVLGGSLAAGAASGRAELLRMAFVLGFFGFGVKAAVFPLHGWLPAAGVAPTPVTALLHAVAVVNAGLFAILRLTYYSYGTQLLYGSWAQAVCLGFACFTIVFGSAMALRLRHLKRRLAYSTVSNLSYILLAGLLCTPAGLAAALTHMVVHSVLKITLFFCAGAILCQTEALPCGPQEYVFQYQGYGRRMPLTFAVFTIASLGLMGVPPFAGFASKWAIAASAAATGLPLGYAGCFALALSAFLTGLYQLDVVITAYFPPRGVDPAAAEGVADPGRNMKAVLVTLTALSLALIAAMPALSLWLGQLAAGAL